MITVCAYVLYVAKYGNETVSLAKRFEISKLKLES